MKQFNQTGKLFRHFFVFLAFVSVFWVSGQVSAATMKTISLVQGWNLVNIPLQPEDKNAEVLLNGLNYASAWKWSDNSWEVLLKDKDIQAYALSKGF